MFLVTKIMKHITSKQEWILLIHQLPPVPTNLRVRTWRKLQSLGALAIKNSVYVLPFSEQAHEDFQWLKQEIESAGGEATVFRAGAVEGATDDEIISAFRKGRDEDYARVRAELDGLIGTIREQKQGGQFSSKRITSFETELDKLHLELERIIAVDFFEARGRRAALTSFERCQKALRSSQSRETKATKSTSAAGASLDLAQYQGRRWVTRRNLHIDRLASAWLIKRFIDKRPRFSFVGEEQSVEGGIPFDMFGAELTHHGEDCTFETMIKCFDLSDDAALGRIAEIVHDIDLKDNKFNRAEAAGLDTVVRSLAKLLKDDRKLVQQANVIFDGLYSLLGEDAENKEKQDGGRQRGRRSESAAKRDKRTRRK